jgi:uncharacterized protein
MTSFDMRRLKLRPGEESEEKVAVRLDPFELGGQLYIASPEEPTARLRIQRASTGTVFELEFTARLVGPCHRCLVDTVVEQHVHAREYEDTKPETDEMRNPYLRADVLDLTSWARDAVALDLPDVILHDPSCAGLCPVCGKDLNVEPHVHEEKAGDPRWSALEELRDRL